MQMNKMCIDITANNNEETNSLLYLNNICLNLKRLFFSLNQWQ